MPNTSTRGGRPTGRALLGRQGGRPAATIAQDVAAVAPVGQPVGPVDLVLVEEVGQTLGELITPAQIAVALQEMPQGEEVGLSQQLGQQPHQAPDQRLAVEGRALRHRLRSEDGPVGPPQEAGRQHELEPGGDAQARRAPVARPTGGCQRQSQPLADAVALHQHDLGLERGQRVIGHEADQQVAQGLGPVAVNDDQA